MGILFSIAYHHKEQHQNYEYRATLWGDKAGYYIYLPMAFIHGFNTEAPAEAASERFGNGFKVEDGKVITKYTCGLALVTWPFFLMIHLLALFSGVEASGFSDIYFYFPLLSGSFYAVFGIVFLYAFLRRYVKSLVAIIIPLTLLLTTNLLYYATVEAYMSHVYSFAFISFFLYILKRNIETDFSHFILAGLLSFSIVIIALIRPTNILLAPLVLFLDANSISSLKHRIIRVFSLRNTLLMLGIGLICVLPQLLYWKYAYGKWLADPYVGESFQYLGNPKIIPVLFAPQNGMIPYVPFFALLLFSMFAALFVKANRFNHVLLTLTFLLALYIISSWDCFIYGCSFGSRPLVDYLPLFALPFASVINGLAYSKRRWILVLIAIMAVYGSYFTINISKVYDGCFYGSLWQWRTYTNLKEKAEVFPFAKKSWNVKTSFEPEETDFFHLNTNSKKDKEARTGTYVTYTDETSEFSNGFSSSLFDISLLRIQEINICLYVKPMDSLQTAWVVCEVLFGKETIFREATEIMPDKIVMGEWNKITQVISLPELHNQSTLKIYGWVPDQETVFFDDLELTFKYQ